MINHQLCEVKNIASAGGLASAQSHLLQQSLIIGVNENQSLPPIYSLQSSLINQHDHHYKYRSYGIYLVKRFVVALTNVCTVKLAQLHQSIRLKSARVIIWPAGVKSHHLGETFFSILLHNSFMELPQSNLKIREKQELISLL